MSSIVVNSKGEILNIDDDNIMRFIPLETRIKECNDTRNKLIELLNLEGISTENKQFFYLIQPTFFKERIYFFTKTEISSSSKNISIANEIKKHPEKIITNPELRENKAKVDYYNSIFPFDDKKNRKWFYLSVCCIEFERNFYDCKRIKIKCNYLQPFNFFINKLKELIISDPNITKITDKYILYNNEIDFNNIHQLLNIAFNTKCNNSSNSEFIDVIKNIKNEYEEKSMQNVYKESNKANKCLMLLNNPQFDNLYEIYKTIKNAVYKQNNEFIYTVTYKKPNQIIIKQACEIKIKAFICDAKAPYKFIVNGNNVNGIKSLIKLLNSNNIEKEQWFKKIEPYINE